MSEYRLYSNHNKNTYSHSIANPFLMPDFTSRWPRRFSPPNDPDPALTSSALTLNVLPADPHDSSALAHRHNPNSFGASPAPPENHNIRRQSQSAHDPNFRNPNMDLLVDFESQEGFIQVARKKKRGGGPPKPTPPSGGGDGGSGGGGDDANKDQPAENGGGGGDSGNANGSGDGGDGNDRNEGIDSSGEFGTVDSSGKPKTNDSPPTIPPSSRLGESTFEDINLENSSKPHDGLRDTGTSGCLDWTSGGDGGPRRGFSLEAEGDTGARDSTITTSGQRNTDTMLAKTMTKFSVGDTESMSGPRVSSAKSNRKDSTQEEITDYDIWSPSGWGSSNKHKEDRRPSSGNGDLGGGREPVGDVKKSLIEDINEPQHPADNMLPSFTGENTSLDQEAKRDTDSLNHSWLSEAAPPKKKKNFLGDHLYNNDNGVYSMHEEFFGATDSKNATKSTPVPVPERRSDSMWSSWGGSSYNEEPKFKQTSIPASDHPKEQASSSGGWGSFFGLGKKLINKVKEEARETFEQPKNDYPTDRSPRNEIQPHKTHELIDIHNDKQLRDDSFSKVLDVNKDATHKPDGKEVDAPILKGIQPNTIESKGEGETWGSRDPGKNKTRKYMLRKTPSVLLD